MVIGVGTSELEVDYHPLRAVGHDTVGTPFNHLSIFYAEDGTLVEEGPVPVEPFRHLGVLQTTKHGGDALKGNVVVVDNALALQFMQGIVNVGGGMDSGENTVQNTSHLNIAVTIVLLVIAVDKVAALVTLAELRLGSMGNHANVERFRRL